MTAKTVTFTFNEDGEIVEAQENLGTEGETPPLTDPLDVKDARDRIANTPVAGGGDQGEQQ